MKITQLRFFALALILILLSSSRLSAQQAPDPIPEHETFTLQSSKLGEARVINVWSPAGYKNSAESLPVLYMLDGGVQEDFPHIANTLAELIEQKKIKPILLVGIENTQRRRDLTGPTEIAKDKTIAPEVGGSEKFRAFLSDELITEINKRYRTSEKKGIIGESLAGLFVTETFFLKPDLFDFYIAFDPSLWWNNAYLVNHGTELLATFPVTPKTFWFAGSGAKDIFKNVGKLAKLLEAKNFKNLKWLYSPERRQKHHTIFRATKEKAIVWTLTNALG